MGRNGSGRCLFQFFFLQGSLTKPIGGDFPVTPVSNHLALAKVLGRGTCFSVPELDLDVDVVREWLQPSIRLAQAK